MYNTYRIGCIGRLHGIHGELTFTFDDDVFDRVDADYVFLKTDGLLVPFFFEEYRFKNDREAIVKFEDIDDRDTAAMYVGCEVYFPRELADNDGMFTYASLIGFEIYDGDKRIGTVQSVDDSTMNILFVLQDGTLIPAADELIEDIDSQKKRITMSLPEGLI